MQDASLEIADNTLLEVQGAVVKVNGNVHNDGDIRVYDGGAMVVGGILVNTGKLTVNDPQMMKQIIVESLRAAGDIAKFGTEFLKRIGWIS